MRDAWRYAVIAVLLAGIGAAPLRAHAALDATAQREVSALLAFVGNSHCTFIRNGSEYSGSQAQAHLQDKLNYLLRKDRVNSAEEFIERAASESSFSGKPYKVNCDGKEQLSADWLKDELQRLRQGQP